MKKYLVISVFCALALFTISQAIWINRITKWNRIFQENELERVSNVIIKHQEKKAVSDSIDQFNLQSVNREFQHNLTYASNLSAYTQKILKGNETTDPLFCEKKNIQVSDNKIKCISLGFSSGTDHPYKFKSQFLFNSFIIRDIQPTSAHLTGIFVITLSFIFFMLLWLLQRQSRRLQSQKKYTRRIIHDLKSPLSYVYSMLSVLELSEGDIQKSKQLTIGKLYIKNLTANIDRLLSEIRLNEKKMILHPSLYDVESRSTELINEFRIIYNEKKITFSLNIPPDTELLYVDPFYFDNCLRNLFDNAIKYSGNEPIITMTLTQSESKTSIIITDNGIGIPLNNRKKVFRSFFRSNEDPAIKGHGIGLAFVRQIVKIHGGRLHLQSSPEKGTTFTITLPDKTVKS